MFRCDICKRALNAEQSRRYQKKLDKARFLKPKKYCSTQCVAEGKKAPENRGRP